MYLGRLNRHGELQTKISGFELIDLNEKRNPLRGK